jgi:hypothetical protein
MRHLKLRSTWLRLRPTDWAAIAFAVLALVLAFLYFRWENSDAQAWLPNIATMFLGLALTVWLVAWIVRREETRRLLPRVGRALAHIQVEFVEFVRAVALDYLTTHAEPKLLPGDALDVLDLWLHEQRSADLPHLELWPGGFTLRELGLIFVEQVDQYDARDRDVLEPSLIAAIRDLYAAGRRARALEGTTFISAPPHLADTMNLDASERSYAALVSGARAFGEVLRIYAPPAVFDVQPDIEQLATQMKRESHEALRDR